MWYNFEVNIKKKKLLKNMTKTVFKGMLTILNLILNSILMFYLPLKTEILPCIREIKETWCVNFLPSLYVISIKFLY